MTDKQRGRNAALNLVIDQFGSVAWQNGLDEEKRKRAAADMEKLVARKEGKSRQAMADVVTPFCKMLKSESQPQPHFNIEHLEAESQDRNDALEIVLTRISFLKTQRQPSANLQRQY